MKLFYIALSYLVPAIAFAQDTAAVGSAGGTSPNTAAPQPSLVESVIPFLLMFIVFYFLLIRPQQKKYKNHVVLVNGLKKGDKVITGGGFVGVISNAKEGEKFVNVAIAEGVEVKVLRSSITELADAPQASNDNKKTKAKLSANS